MGLKTFLSNVSAAALLITASVTAPVLADMSNIEPLAQPTDKGKPVKGSGGGDGADPQPSDSWMHDDVPLAWGYKGGSYKGLGVTMTFVDDFNSGALRAGNLGDGDKSLTHGGWTSKEGGMIAPDADIAKHDYLSGDTVTLPSDSGVFNVLNLSYSDVYGNMTEYEKTTYNPDGSIEKTETVIEETATLYAEKRLFTDQETSIINFAANGQAFVAKSAGNDGGTAVGDFVTSGRGRFAQTVRDYLSVGLMDAEGDSPDTFSGVWVGALDGNSSVTHNPDGTTTVQKTVSIADYSTQAGTDARVNKNYLMVGVDTALNGGFEGTSFAAPIVSGYAAILASKFTTATPLQVKTQLLDTARMDTINDYSLSVHGQGEASIYRAVAPISIQ